MHYLLGESCVLSSMGSHFRGPGGLPLAMHADGSSVGMTETSLVANCNYALTPITQTTARLSWSPQPPKKPSANRWENWRAGQQSIFDVMAAQPKAEELDAITWTPPSGAVTMDIAVGDAVIWHGNTWHGGWRRDARYSHQFGGLFLPVAYRDPRTPRRRSLS